MRISKLICLLALMTLLATCKKRNEYIFVVINPTNYRIDNIDFTCAVDKFHLSVEPNSTSSEFILRKDALGIFSEPLICMTITDYSDSTKYKNGTGNTISFKGLSHKKVNTIRLSQITNTLYPSDIFSISIE
jgi:hypothetical protein